MIELLLAASQDGIRFETAVLLLMGVGLLVLAKLVADLRSELRSLRTRSSGSVQKPNPTQAVGSASLDSEISLEVVAAISAAVCATLGASHRVVSVSPLSPFEWSKEGRTSIFRSHAIQKETIRPLHRQGKG